MADESCSPDGRERQLDAAIAAYLGAEDAGRAPDRREFIALHPSLSAELETFFADQDRVRRFAALRTAGEGQAPPRPEALRDEGQAVAESPTQIHDGIGATPALAGFRQVGDYELLEEIGEGGMGVVFKARRRRYNRVVALKMIRAGHFATPRDIRRFRLEARAVAELDHPHIVRVYKVGKHQGLWYFSMKLVRGGNLAGRLSRFRGEPRTTARLVATIARAMDHAHKRGILHRDLKPANILMDRLGRPFVTDFGLAKLMESDSGLTRSGDIIGTPEYMSPEQASGRNGEVTTASDVYSLGAIFYALLTGRPPFVAETRLETLRQVRECEPRRPQALNPAVDPDLEKICLQCVEKDPQWRYGSMQALAEDLERWEEGKPIQARSVGGAERFGRWCRRHPAAVALATFAVGLLVTVTATAVAMARVRHTVLIREVGRSSLSDAKHVASTVLLELRRLRAPVAEKAEDRRLREMLERKDWEGLQAYIEQLVRTSDDRYKSWYVLDAEGTLRAVWPANQTILDLDFRGRDYFQGAKHLARASGEVPVHISRVFQAENDHLYKFAMAAPVRSGPGPDDFLGVIVTTITTRSTLGSHPLNDERRKVVLVGRSDPNPPRAGAPAPQLDEYLILVHPVYDTGNKPVGVPGEWLRAVHQPHPGGEFELPDRDLAPEQAIDDAYYDPLGTTHPEFAGRWLAVFAPVGNTELAVIVQQKYDEVIDPNKTVALGLFLGSGSAFCLGAILIGTLVYGGRLALGGRDPRPTSSAGK